MSRTLKVNLGSCYSHQQSKFLTNILSPVSQQRPLIGAKSSTLTKVKSTKKRAKSSNSSVVRTQKPITLEPTHVSRSSVVSFSGLSSHNFKTVVKKPTTISNPRPKSSSYFSTQPASTTPTATMRTLSAASRRTSQSKTFSPSTTTLRPKLPSTKALGRNSSL